VLVEGRKDGVSPGATHPASQSRTGLGGAADDDEPEHGHRADPGPLGLGQPPCIWASSTSTVWPVPRENLPNYEQALVELVGLVGRRVHITASADGASGGDMMGLVGTLQRGDAFALSGHTDQGDERIVFVVGARPEGPSGGYFIMSRGGLTSACWLRKGGEILFDQLLLLIDGVLIAIQPDPEKYDGSAAWTE
jgi:hypothetical protein